MDMLHFTRRLKQQAGMFGFSQCGIAPALSPSGFAPLFQWLNAGYAGEMHYIAKRKEAYRHPSGVLPPVRTLVMLAFPYNTDLQSKSTTKSLEPGFGRVSRYAWGDVDYHDLIHDRLDQLSSWIREQIGSCQLRGIVDSAPLLEREFAQLAGLGWIGKNTMLIHPDQGSYFFLAALLTDLDLIPDAPIEQDHCGSCTACLDACPTSAFVQPRVLDATKCISYLTIELRSEIPEELRTGIGDWVFGCDVCQDVCPWNRKSPQSLEKGLAPHASLKPLDLLEALDLSDETFRKRFKRTPIWRSKRRGLIRNCLIAIGNQRYRPAISKLISLLDDPETLIRNTAIWALGEIGGAEVVLALQEYLEIEVRDPSTTERVHQAMAHASDTSRIG